MIEDPHAAVVDAWLARAPRPLTRDGRIALFERAIGALWRRAYVPLGDVTVAAIFARVLHDGCARCSELAALVIDADGVRWKERPGEATARPRPDEELAEALRFVLIEFLRVVGHLTADVLTPALHATLASLAPGGELDVARGSDGDGSEGAPRS